MEKERSQCECKFLLTTITTRLCSSSDSTRAISRMTVVLPTPGRPRNSTELGTAVQSINGTTGQGG